MSGSSKRGIIAKKPKIKRTAALFLAMAALAAFPVSASALDDETDTIWGSVPATVYITRELYRHGNSITVPIEYIEAIEGEDSIRQKTIDAFWEAQRQSCYLFGDQSLSVTVEEDEVHITRRPFFSLQTERQMRDAVEEEAGRVLSKIITDGMTDYQKAVAIYEYIRDVSEYDWDAYDAITGDDCQGDVAEWVNAVSAYGVLFDGLSVCQGDAQAYTLLARKAGLTTMMATGVMPNGNGHAWNRVWANSQWYEVDCCYGQFCATFSAYQANTGVIYGGVGIMESSADDFYGV